MSLLTTITSPPDPTALALALTILLATYLTNACFTPPNQPSTAAAATAAKPKDRVTFATTPGFLWTRRAAILLISAHHALLALLYHSLPTSTSTTSSTSTTTPPESLFATTAICPNPPNLNPRLFTFTPATVIPLLAILIFAPIRLACYRHLGGSFTFRLATPRKLVTSGPYRYVQHPSYTCQAVVVAANFFLFERRDGVAGCFLPAVVVSGSQYRTLFQVGSCAVTGVAFWLLTIRIWDEEAMLKKTFGREWEDYHRRTKRFIPFIF